MMARLRNSDPILTTAYVVIFCFIVFLLAFPFLHAQGQQQARPAKPDPQVKILKNGWAYSKIDTHESWFKLSGITGLQLDPDTIENFHKWPVVWVNSPGGRRFRMDVPSIERGKEIIELILTEMGAL